MQASKKGAFHARRMLHLDEVMASTGKSRTVRDQCAGTLGQTAAKLDESVAISTTSPMVGLVWA